MNSPFCGKFRVSQQYKPGTHDGLDLVGIDSADVHATISGTVQYAGWENANNHSQGFGYYVCIRGKDNLYYYFGHLKENSIKVRTGDLVSCTQVIGIMGSTGRSTGPHLHYEIRGASYKGAKVYDVCAMSQIPNVLYGIYDDGYRPNGSTNSSKTFDVSNKEDIKALQNALNNHNYNCGSADGIIGARTTAAMFSALADLWLK